jgi:hypothetical protein
MGKFIITTNDLLATYLPTHQTDVHVVSKGIFYHLRSAPYIHNKGKKKECQQIGINKAYRDVHKFESMPSQKVMEAVITDKLRAVGIKVVFVVQTPNGIANTGNAMKYTTGFDLKDSFKVDDLTALGATIVFLEDTPFMIKFVAPFCELHGICFNCHKFKKGTQDKPPARVCPGNCIKGSSSLMLKRKLAEDHTKSAEEGAKRAAETSPFI